jgi:hypothetical protein
MKQRGWLRIPPKHIHSKYQKTNLSGILFLNLFDEKNFDCYAVFVPYSTILNNFIFAVVQS